MFKETQQGLPNCGIFSTLEVDIQDRQPTVNLGRTPCEKDES